MLITCPECGKSASDTVKACPHCGFKFKKCDECGSIIALEAQTCTNCGFEFKPKTEEKKPEEKASEPKKAEKKKPDPKKERERLFEQEEKKARKVVAYIEKMNLIFKWTVRGIYLLATILIVIAVIKFIDFATYKEKSDMKVLKLLANAHKINDSIHALLLSGLIGLIVAPFVSAFKTFLYSGFIHNKIKQEGFDYKTFYENYPLGEDGIVCPPILVSNNVLDPEEVSLIDTIRYKEDLPSIAPKILRNLIGLSLIIISIVLIYPFLTENVDSFMALAILGKEKEFQLLSTSKLIWTTLVLIVKFIVFDWILATEDMDAAYNWLKKIHKNKQSVTVNSNEND